MLNFEKKHISMYMCTCTLSHTHITKLVSQSTREHSAMGVGEVVGSGTGGPTPCFLTAQSPVCSFLDREQSADRP